MLGGSKRNPHKTIGVHWLWMSDGMGSHEDIAQKAIYTICVLRVAFFVIRCWVIVIFYCGPRRRRRKKSVFIHRFFIKHHLHHHIPLRLVRVRRWRETLNHPEMESSTLNDSHFVCSSYISVLFFASPGHFTDTLRALFFFLLVSLAINLDCVLGLVARWNVSISWEHQLMNVKKLTSTLAWTRIFCVLTGCARDIWTCHEYWSTIGRGEMSQHERRFNCIGPLRAWACSTWA